MSEAKGMTKFMKTEYVKPDIISYSHHAFPLGVILTKNNAFNWMLSNYITLYSGLEMNAFNFLVNYNSNPFLDMRNVYSAEIKAIIDSVSLKNWVKFELDQGMPVELMVDYYYLPLTGAFCKTHFMHEILITGYTDDERVIYWDYTKRIYQENVCEWNDIRIFNSKTFYGDGVAGKVYYAKEANYDLDINLVKFQLDKYLLSENPYSDIAIWGDYQAYRNCFYGISCTQILAEEIKKSDKIDIRYLNVFYEHKKLMWYRMKALKKENSLWCNVLQKAYENLQSRWKMLMYGAIKANFYDQEKRDKEKVRLANKIVDLYEMEITILSDCLK